MPVKRKIEEESVGRMASITIGSIEGTQKDIESRLRSICAATATPSPTSMVSKLDAKSSLLCLYYPNHEIRKRTDDQIPKWAQTCQQLLLVGVSPTSELNQDGSWRTLSKADALLLDPSIEAFKSDVLHVDTHTVTRSATTTEDRQSLTLTSVLRDSTAKARDGTSLTFDGRRVGSEVIWNDGILTYVVSMWKRDTEGDGLEGSPGEVDRTKTFEAPGTFSGGQTTEHNTYDTTAGSQGWEVPNLTEEEWDSVIASVYGHLGTS